MKLPSRFSRKNSQFSTWIGSRNACSTRKILTNIFDNVCQMRKCSTLSQVIFCLNSNVPVLCFRTVLWRKKKWSTATSCSSVPRQQTSARPSHVTTSSKRHDVTSLKSWRDVTSQRHITPKSHHVTAYSCVVLTSFGFIKIFFFFHHRAPKIIYDVMMSSNQDIFIVTC